MKLIHNLWKKKCSIESLIKCHYWYNPEFCGLHFVNHHHQTWWQEFDWINYSVCLDFSNKPTFIYIDLFLMKWQSIEKISSTPSRDRAKSARQIKIKHQTFNNFCNTGPIWKTSIEYFSINCNWSINQLLVKSKLSTINCTAIAIFHIRIEDFSKFWKFSVNFSQLTLINW